MSEYILTSGSLTSILHSGREMGQRYSLKEVYDMVLQNSNRQNLADEEKDKYISNLAQAQDVKQHGICANNVLPHRMCLPSWIISAGRWVICSLYCIAFTQYPVQLDSLCEWTGSRHLQPVKSLWQIGGLFFNHQSLYERPNNYL